MWASKGGTTLAWLVDGRAALASHNRVTQDAPLQKRGRTLGAPPCFLYDELPASFGATLHALAPRHVLCLQPSGMPPCLNPSCSPSPTSAWVFAQA